MSFRTKMRNPRHNPATKKTRCPFKPGMTGLTWYHSVKTPPPTPPFGKWRGERNYNTCMSFLPWAGISDKTKGLFIPLWRGWPDLSGREMTKSRITWYKSVPHLQCGIILSLQVVTNIPPRWGDDFLSLSNMVGEHYGKLSTSPVEPSCTEFACHSRKARHHHLSCQHALKRMTSQCLKNFSRFKITRAGENPPWL